jgi:hypothetical protein
MGIGLQGLGFEGLSLRLGGEKRSFREGKGEVSNEVNRH